VLRHPRARLLHGASRGSVGLGGCARTLDFEEEVPACAAETCPVSTGRRTRRVQSVRGDGHDGGVRPQTAARRGAGPRGRGVKLAAPCVDETCPISTEGWTRRVHFVREGGGARYLTSCCSRSCASSCPESASARAAGRSGATLPSARAAGRSDGADASPAAGAGAGAGAVAGTAAGIGPAKNPRRWMCPPTAPCSATNVCPAGIGQRNGKPPVPPNASARRAPPPPPSGCRVTSKPSSRLPARRGEGRDVSA
jgi:hypothetical protein